MNCHISAFFYTFYDSTNSFNFNTQKCVLGMKKDGIDPNMHKLI